MPRNRLAMLVRHGCATSLLIAVALAVVARDATALEIDTFSDPAGLQAGTFQVTTTGPGILGGERVVVAVANSGLYDVADGLGFGFTASGELIYVGSGLQVFAVTYGGPSGGGLGGADLTDAGASDRLRIGLFTTTGPYDLVVNVRSGATVATAVVPVPSGEQVDTAAELLFADFAPTIDFSTIDEIELVISGDGTSDVFLGLDELATTAPPSALAASSLLPQLTLLMLLASTGIWMIARASAEPTAR